MDSGSSPASFVTITGPEAYPGDELTNNRADMGWVIFITDNYEFELEQLSEYAAKNRF